MGKSSRVSASERGKDSQGIYEKAFEIYKKLSWQEPDNVFFHERLADLKGKVVHRLARTRGKAKG